VKILVDTREQAPYSFSKHDVEVIPATLPTGDYSLPGFEDRIAVERKSLDDLVGCLKGSNRERFKRELQRAAHYDLFTVVVEGSLNYVSKGRYRSEMKAHAVIQTIVAFQVRYRVAFIWAGNRAGGEYITFSLLEKYLTEIFKRFEHATKTQHDKGNSKNDG
jgi:ERCC4-type nuclease